MNHTPDHRLLGSGLGRAEAWLHNRPEPELTRQQAFERRSARSVVDRNRGARSLRVGSLPWRRPKGVPRTSAPDRRRLFLAGRRRRGQQRCQDLVQDLVRLRAALGDPGPHRHQASGNAPPNRSSSSCSPLTLRAKVPEEVFVPRSWRPRRRDLHSDRTTWANNPGTDGRLARDRRRPPGVRQSGDMWILRLVRAHLPQMARRVRS